MCIISLTSRISPSVFSIFPPKPASQPVLNCRYRRYRRLGGVRAEIRDSLIHSCVHRLLGIDVGRHAHPARGDRAPAARRHGRAGAGPAPAQPGRRLRAGPGPGDGRARHRHCRRGAPAEMPRRPQGKVGISQCQGAI